MTQLFAAFGVNAPLLIAQAVNFGIVLVALWYFLYRPVMTTLDKRRETIAQGVQDAERAAEKLSVADDEASSRVQRADVDADRIVSSARDAALAEKTRILEAAQSRAEQATRDAEARAKEESLRMLRESEREIARLSVLAAEKVLRS